MSGPDDVAVVWLGEASPREDARHALEGWARARGAKLVVAEGSFAEMPIDLAVGERVERELERAREAISGLDADAAERALARAESELRAHPELPQAAWLRAEVLRGWSSRWLRVEPHDEARARTAWQDAEALDGGRAAGVGETAFPPRPTHEATFTVRGVSGGRAVLRIDGRALGASAGGTLVANVDLAAGEHQVVVQIDDHTVHASWVGLGGAATERVDLAVPESASCSAAAMRSVERDGDHVRAPGASCARWVAAVETPRPGRILVARCERDACGPLLEWHTERFPAAPPPIATRAPWPGWATWVLVGVGAAAAGTVGLVAAGAFETRPAEPRFVAGGVRNE